MSKTHLFAGQCIAAAIGLGLTLYGWIGHVPDASSVGLPILFGALAAFGIPRPADK